MCSFIFLSSRFVTYGLSFILGKFCLEKTPLNFGSSLKYLVMSILLKGWSGTKKFYPYFLFLLFLLLFQQQLLLLKKVKVVPLELPKKLTKHQEIHLLFFISCYTIWVTPSINTPKIFLWFYGFYNIIHIFIRNE